MLPQVEEQELQDFHSWLEGMSTDSSDPYIQHILDVDVVPCLSFANKQVNMQCVCLCVCIHVCIVCMCMCTFWVCVVHVYMHVVMYVLSNNTYRKLYEFECN